MSQQAETAAYRRRSKAASADVARGAVSLWPLLDQDDLRSFVAWQDAIIRLVREGRVEATDLAADYLRRSAAAQGVTTAVQLPDVLDEVRLREALRITGFVAYRVARRAGQTPAQASASALVRSTGTALTATVHAGRDTVRQTVARDVRAKGWRRVTDGQPCSFCALLASRGEVYKESTVRFQAHGADGCTAEPVWQDLPLSADAQRWDELYIDSTAGLSGRAALNAFRRAYAKQAASTNPG